MLHRVLVPFEAGDAGLLIDAVWPAVWVLLFRASGAISCASVGSVALGVAIGFLAELLNRGTHLPDFGDSALVDWYRYACHTMVASEAPF
jgi:hypothetical protein